MELALKLSCVKNKSYTFPFEPNLTLRLYGFISTIRSLRVLFLLCQSHVLCVGPMSGVCLRRRWRLQVLKRGVLKKDRTMMHGQGQGHVGQGRAFKLSLRKCPKLSGRYTVFFFSKHSRIRSRFHELIQANVLEGECWSSALRGGSGDFIPKHSRVKSKMLWDNCGIIQANVPAEVSGGILGSGLFPYLFQNISGLGQNVVR